MRYFVNHIRSCDNAWASITLVVALFFNAIGFTMFITAPVYAWDVVVTAQPSDDPIVVCEGEQVVINFSHQITNHPPSSTAECTVHGPTWEWSGDGPAFSHIYNNSGTYTVSATATATYTRSPTDPNNDDCPGSESKSGSKTVTVVVLTGQANSWTNISTPAFNNPPSQEPYTHSYLVQDPNAICKDHYIDTGHLLFLPDIDKQSAIQGGCSAKLEDQMDYYAGVEAGYGVDLCGVSISSIVGVTHHVTTTNSWGSTPHKRYRAAKWIPVTIIDDKFEHSKMRQECPLTGNGPWQNEDPPQPVITEVRRVDLDGADWKVDAACCPHNP